MRLLHYIAFIKRRKIVRKMYRVGQEEKMSTRKYSLGNGEFRNNQVHANEQDAHISLDSDLLGHAHIIWDYMLLNHTLVQSDIIFVLGNNDIRVAEHAANLWARGYGKYIVISGNLGNLTRGRWQRPEYEVFRQVAVSMGVPASKIIVEKDATNTGENVRFTRKILESRNIMPKSVILVQTPYMERRTYATFLKQWSPSCQDTNIQVSVSSPPIPLLEYPNREVGNMRDVICIMLGCLERLAVYPLKGFSVPQEIPDRVLVSYTKLISTGRFDDFLVGQT